MKEKRQEIDKINLRGLLDTLYVPVFKVNPLLIKKASLDKDFDSVAIHLDSASWKKEFENFSDLKLRPGNLLSQFEEKIITSDSLFVYNYQAKDYEKEDLDSFMIGFNKNEKIQFLDAYINSQNYFSSSSQHLKITFSPVLDGRLLPKSYSVTGWQKIKTKDTVHFSIDALIRY